MRQARYWIVLLPLFLVLTCAGAFAQANSEVTGTVTDQTGAVVGGANIVLSDPATGTTHTTVSSGSGLYDFAGLNPASYNLRITAKGFQNYVQTGIVVNVSATFTVNVKLTIGSASETVSVVADALTVQTDSNVISTLITSEDITSIATENRNFSSLAALGLGVSSKLGDSSQSLGAFGSDWSIQFNGLREAHNIWLIDGGESADRGGGGGMQILPSQDAIAEFQMMTSNYPPDYGISSGATISLSLKSGTSQFHGAAWEENRATAYNANSWINKSNKNPRVPTHYNIYGFAVGGPIYIPGKYNTNKNKGFFFFSQEWRKTSSVGTSFNRTIDPLDIPKTSNIQTIGGVTGLQYKLPAYAADRKITGLVVPNVALTSDYYLKYLAPLHLTPGQPFPNNVIPQSLFDHNAQTYLISGVLPPVTDAASGKNAASVPLPQKVTDTVIRGDYNFNEKWALLVHYIQDHQNQTYGKSELGWCGCDYNSIGSQLSAPAHSATAKLTGAIKSNLLVEVSINYDGNGSDIIPTTLTAATVFLPGTAGDTSSLPKWTVSPVVPAYAVSRNVWPNMGWDSTLGQTEETATEPYHNAAQDYAPKVDVSYTQGKHQLKFGFSYNHYTKNQMLYSSAQGYYNFGSLSGDTLMDTLLGLPSTYSQAKKPYTRHYYSNTTSAYAQDNWHVTPRLSLQIGLRYDAMPATVERQNLMGNFNQADYNTGAAAAPLWNTDGTIKSTSPYLYAYDDGSGAISSYVNGTDIAGYEGTSRGTIKNDYQTYQPRLGFSEDLFGNGKTIIRGGFGTFYEHFQGNAAFNIATSAPFNPSLTLSNPYFSTPGTNYSTGAVVSPSSLIFAGSGSSAAQTFRAPGVAMYSLGVQRELTHSIIWTTQYVGNLQWHQNVQNESLNGLSPSIGLVDIGLNDSPATCTVKSTAPPFTCMDARQVSGDSKGAYSKDVYPNPAYPATPPVPATLPEAVSFANVAGMNAYRTYPGYGSMTQDINTLTGNYNGLQSALRIQNRWGLSGEIDYTYSHVIDVQSQDRNEISNPWNLKYDKASGDYDRRHIFQANYVYNLPFFNKEAGLLKTLAGGWQIAGTLVKQSGVPQNVTLNDNGIDTVGLGGGYVNRPNITAGGKLHYPKTSSKWFDASRIDNNVTPSWAGGTNLGFGNWGRDTLVLPGRFNLTTSLYKTFQIYKTVNFQMKFESFNTLNHTEWSGVDTGTGAITGTQDPRALQLAGKFNF
jgi:hypothetical protein